MANEITLKTRLLNKYNQTIAPTEILGAGEINFVEVKVPLQDGSATVDAVLMKVGDGHTEYQNLDYVVAPAADVYAWAKKARGEAADIDYKKDASKITVQAAIDALYAAIDALSGNSGESIADLFEQLKALGDKIDGEIARATAAEAELDGKITAEAATRKAADEALTQADAGLDAAIKAEEATRIAADDVLDGEIAEVAADLADEIARADAAEKKNAANIKTIADDYVTSADIANFETKANVKKVADDLSAYKTSNNEEVGKKANASDVYTKTEIDAKNYATKAEAEAYANAKDGAIAAAQSKANDAYSLAESKVTAETGKRLITDAEATKLAGLKNYDDTGVKADITANTNAIAGIKDGATIDSFADVEAALAGKQATGDYATKAYVDEEVGAVATVANEAKNRIDTFLDTEGVADTVDSLHDIKAWMEGEGVNATELTEAIAAEAKLRKDADDALDGRINALEAKEDKDTTYSAGDGLALNGTVFSIADASTGFTFILDANA